jgi:hypothetical protein
VDSIQHQWRALSAIVLSATVLGCGGGAVDTAREQPQRAASPAMPPHVVAQSFRSAGLVVGASAVSADPAGGQRISVPILTQHGARTIAATVPDSAVSGVRANLVAGNLVDWTPGGSANTAAVPADALQTFNVILRKGSSTAAQFNMSKFGPAVSRHNDVPGPMVAAGWVYKKAGTTITIGDGRIVTIDMAGRPYEEPIKRYEEKFVVARDAKVFNINTSNYALSHESDFASIPVTADYDYNTRSRQAAYVLLDNNYERASSAKVVAIWYFTPQSTSDGRPVWDVPTLSPLLANLGNDPVSGLPYVDINASGVTAAPYTRSTEPFEMVRDTMYFIGDNEVASYVFKADMGTPDDPSDDRVIKVDAGWANSGYQYWRNMELVGIDPRSVTDTLLTHGHGDHYGTVVEHLQMMDHAGKSMRLWAAREESLGIQQDARNNLWNLAGALPGNQTVIRARTTDYYTFDQWYDFGNVQIKVVWSPGHTPGTTNMLFRVKNPVDGKFYTFGYHGGYGVGGLTTPNANNGWLRLSFEHGFSFLQQTLDVDFVSPQHTNQFPIVEVYQALKAYNRDPANAQKQLTMMDAMRSQVFDAPEIGGRKITGEFANQLEKRRSVITYRASDAANPSYRSIETSGPFKPGRENGLANITATLLDGGKIVQGFVGPQNKNPVIPLLADGIVTATDEFTNDPGGFFVQVAIKVDDAYQGFLPEGLTQFSPGTNSTITYRGGPVESVRTAAGEVLRTQRLNSVAEAQAVLATIAAGRTVTISLTPSSEIVVPVDLTKTFR